MIYFELRKFSCNIIFLLIPDIVILFDLFLAVSIIKIAFLNSSIEEERVK
jgi:hypothetical protein